MAKGKYEGIIVGGSAWKIEPKNAGEQAHEGYTYNVLSFDDFDEKTGLHKSVSLLFVSAPSKGYEAGFKYGDKVEFYGEYQKGFNGKEGKIKYTDMRKVKGDK